MEKAIYYEAKPGMYRQMISKKKVTLFKWYERMNSGVTDSQLRVNSLKSRLKTKVTQSAWNYLDNNEFGNAEQFDWSGSS